MDFRQHTPYRLQTSDFSEQKTPPQNRFILYTDGAYFKQYRLGGWGLAIYNHQSQLIDSLYGTQLSSSSLEMELIAAIRGLTWLQNQPINIHASLYTDAQILLQGLFEKYPIWQKNNWINCNGNPVVFAKLWQQLHALAISLNVDFYWVKGHKQYPDPPGNHLADRLARESILKIHGSD